MGYIREGTAGRGEAGQAQSGGEGRSVKLTCLELFF